MRNNIYWLKHVKSTTVASLGCVYIVNSYRWEWKVSEVNRLWTRTVWWVVWVVVCYHNSINNVSVSFLKRFHSLSTGYISLSHNQFNILWFNTSFVNGLVGVLWFSWLVCVSRLKTAKGVQLMSKMEEKQTAPKKTQKSQVHWWLNVAHSHWKR